MQKLIEFTADQKDGFEEIVNIGMGRAGDSLARLLGVFVELTAPSIRFILSDNIGVELNDLIGVDTVSGVRQGFFGAEGNTGIYGEAITIFTDTSFNELTVLLAFDDDLTERGKQELLLDISNLLNGACLNGIADQLDDVLGYSAPCVIGQEIPIYELLDQENLNWEHALVLKVNYRVEDRSFTCDLLLLMPEKAIESLVSKIDSILEKL
jgi:chemotaxis protein CheY-P-specific phosphatase CheC|tara:strand:- start:5012 stop:5641 length:630 start_codon:yes stop_codon:yes gene_type:complete